MRKEYKTENIPFKENLVFYAPLMEGDLTDHISGNTGYELNASTGNLTWNADNQSYRLHTETNYDDWSRKPTTLVVG